MAVALAILVYLVSDETAKVVLELLPADGGGLFDKLFGDHHSANKLRYRRLPQGRRDVAAFTAIPEVPKGSAAVAGFVAEAPPTEEGGDVFCDRDEGPPQETERALPDRSHALPDPPRGIPETIPDAPKVVPGVHPDQARPKHKADKELSPHERNRREHLERWKD